MSSATMNRRTFLEVSGLTALGLGALAACAPTPGPGSATGPVTNWRAFDNVPQSEWYSKNVIDAFNASHDYAVDLAVKQQSNIDQDLQVALTAGQAPDLIRSGGAPHVLRYAGAGYLADLSDYSTQYGWDSKYQKWAIQSSLSPEGKLFGLPTEYNSVVMFYNPETFRKNGWTVPKNRKDFETICKEAKDQGMLPIASGNAERDKATGWYASGLLNAIVGPDAVYSGLIGETEWTDPVFVDAFAQIQDYCQKGWFGGGPETYATLKFGDMYSKLANGEAAMIIMLSWAFQTLPPFFGDAAGNDATWDWAAVPPLGPDTPEDLYILAIGSSLSINAHSAKIDDAAGFLDWSLDPKLQLAGVADVAMPLAPIVVSESDAPSNLNPQLAGFYSALSSSKVVGYGSWCSFPPDCATYMYTETDRLLFNQLSPADFCAGFEETFQKSYDAGLVPPVAPPNMA